MRDPERAVAPIRRPFGGSARAHKAIIDATLELLRSVRYTDLTMEAIAAKARVGKATVYRWWPSKGAVVAEAIGSTLRVEDPPETGDFRADLVAALDVSISNYSRSDGAVLIAALVSDLVDDPALLASFLEDFVLPRRRVVTDLIERGIRAGYIAKDRDPELLMDMWAGAVIYRGLMKHLSITDDLATRLVDAVLVEQPKADKPSAFSKASPRAAKSSTARTKAGPKSR